MRRMTLEKMKDFFENRIEEYDDHMLNEIDSANEFYPFTAELLPKSKKCRSPVSTQAIGNDHPKYSIIRSPAAPVFSHSEIHWLYRRPHSTAL